MTLKQKVESCRDFTQKTLHDGTSTEILSAKKQMLERTKHLQELHNSSPLAPVTKPSTTIFYQMDKIEEVVRSLGVVVDLQQCSIVDTPAKIHVGKSASVEVILKDTKGQPIHNASKAITAKVTLSFIDDDNLTPIVVELQNGKYSVIFTPKRYRNHNVSIQINGNHITGSPVELELDSLVEIDKPYYNKYATVPDNKAWSSYESSVSTSVTHEKPVQTTSEVLSPKLKSHSRSSTTFETRQYSTPHLYQPSSSKSKRFSYS